MYIELCMLIYTNVIKIITSWRCARINVEAKKGDRKTRVVVGINATCADKAGFHLMYGKR